MRIAILSDVHANLEALQATLRDVVDQRASRIVCLGDIVGRNANPAECVALLQEHDALCVAGNHDRAVTRQISLDGFSQLAARAVTWTRERLSADVLEFLAALPLHAAVENHLLAVHGALLLEGGCEKTRLDTDERRLQSFEALVRHPSGARVCAYGHTHHIAVFELRSGRVQALAGDEIHLHDDAHYLINPGAVGHLRRTGERRATYVIFDTARRTVSIRHVQYDASIPLAKTRHAGLAPLPRTLGTSIRAALVRSARRLGVYAFLRRAVRSWRTHRAQG